MAHILTKFKLFNEKFTGVGKMNTYTHKTINWDIYVNFSNRFPNTPEYVKEEIFRSLIDSKPDVVAEIKTRYHGDPIMAIGKKYIDILNSNWKIEVVCVNPDDFNDSTLQAFEEREFGDKNSYQVEDDKIRTEYQRKIAKTDGTNEPVILLKTPTGYEVLEGWHRTMAILRLGDNGEDYKNWNKVKIKAWISDLI